MAGGDVVASAEAGDCAVPDGRRRLDAEPDADGEDRSSTTRRVGVTAGLWSGGIQFGLPMDQRLDEAFSLVYTTEPLEEPVHIVGRPRVVLHVASTASVIGFAVSLSDVAPDGRPTWSRRAC